MGVSGRVASVVVAAADLPEQWRPSLGQPFSFDAHTAWVVGQTHPDQAFGDDLHPVAGAPSYP